MNPPRVPLVDLKAQYRSIKAEVDAAVARVIDSTSFILGEEVDEFERQFAKFCEVEHCIGCGNGTDAISLALQAVGVRPGDEVITVSHTFIATAEAITAVGAVPIFVDVSAATLLMDVDRIEERITAKTKAIVPVHLYGQMVEMGPVMALARRRGLKVVEDAAQAHGARQEGRRAGSIGDAATFSFYPGKNLGAYGDAGAIVTNDPVAAAWLRKARNHGRASKYEHDFEARNSRLDGIQGAVLGVKLAHLDEWNAKRRALAKTYDRLLARSPSARPVQVLTHNESAYHLYVIRVAQRDTVLARLAEQAVEAGVHYPVPLHRQRAYEYLGLKSGALPVTEAAAGEILSLPLFPELDAAVCERIVSIIQ